MKMTTLGEVCEVLDKKRKPITKRDRVAGPYPYYGATGILDYVEDWIFDERLILLGEDGAKWGRNEQSAFIIDGRTWVNNHAHVLNPRRDVVDDRYVTYYLNHVSLDPFISGTTIPKLTQKSMVNIQIPLPPLEEQKRIAGILDEADRVRKKTQALIDKYDELAQSIFLDMFGDPVTNPKGWEVKPLQDLLVQKPDNGFFAKKDKYGPEGVPVVWLSDFIDRTYVSQKELKRAQVEPKDKKYELEYGDALFCRSSLTVEGIGKCSIVPKTMDEPTIFECHIIRLKLNLGELVPEYLRFLTDTTFFRQQVMRNAKTSTMTTIAQDGISQVAIPLPPLSVQEDFCRRVTLMQHQKQLVEDAIDEGHLVFNSLLQKAFKGELT